ncbi:MAG: hypothetical protein CME61_05190 [Halobacteriovoraceae bacterium]|nr:hypothetical protein [Halobacteriovoraceae bacterium]
MKNILLVIILLLSGVDNIRAAKKSEELQAEESLIYDAQKYEKEVVSVDEIFNPNKMQVYGAMSGDRWKAYNAIYSIFGIENDVNFNRLVDRMILQNKSSSHLQNFLLSYNNFYLIKSNFQEAQYKILLTFPD